MVSSQRRTCIFVLMCWRSVAQTSESPLEASLSRFRFYFSFSLSIFLLVNAYDFRYSQSNGELPIRTTVPIYWISIIDQRFTHMEVKVFCDVDSPTIQLAPNGRIRIEVINLFNHSLAQSIFEQISSGSWWFVPSRRFCLHKNSWCGVLWWLFHVSCFYLSSKDRLF